MIFWGKRQLGKPRPWWIYNIKMDRVKQGEAVRTGLMCRDTVMNLLVPYSVGKLLSCCTTGGISRKAQVRSVELVMIF
jgi:hypothetical protein